MLGATLLLFAWCETASAANSTWQSANGNWTDPANWNNGVPGSTDTAFFGNTPADAPVAVNINGAQSINIFNFTNTDARTYTFSGSDLTFLTKDSATDARILTGAAATSAITINNNIVIAAGFGGPDSDARLTIGGTTAGTSNFTTITVNGNILSGSGAGVKTLAFNSSATATIIINGTNSAGFTAFGGAGEVIAGSTSALGAGSVQKTTSSTLSLRSDVTVDGSSYSWTTSGHTTSIRISELSNSSANRTLTFNNRTIGTGGSMAWVDNVNSTGKLILELKYSGGTAQSMNLATNASGIVRFAQSGNTTHSGVISGDGQVEKIDGNGITTFNVANTYTGTTTVSSGTLLLSGVGSVSNTSEVNVATGAVFSVASIDAASYTFGTNQTISGTGTIAAGGKNISLLGSLSPGNSPGTLTFNMGAGTLSLGSDVDLIFDLGTSSDLVVLSSGILNIGSGLEFDNFSFTAGSGFGAGTYTLFQTGQNIGGALGTNISGQVGGFSAMLEIVGTNLVLNVSVIPEPSTAALLLLGGLYFVGRRRTTRRPKLPSALP